MRERRLVEQRRATNAVIPALKAAVNRLGVDDNASGKQRLSSDFVRELSCHEEAHLYAPGIRTSATRDARAPR